MKWTGTFVLTALLAAGLGLGAASCSNDGDKKPPAQQQGAAPPAQPGAPNGAGPGQGMGQGPGGGRFNRDGRRGPGGRGDGMGGGRGGMRGERGELREKSRKLCEVDLQLCKTLRDMRRAMKDHCDASPDLCDSTRPKARELTEAALDSCLEDNAGCADTLKKLDSQLSDLVKMR